MNICVCLEYNGQAGLKKYGTCDESKFVSEDLFQKCLQTIFNNSVMAEQKMQLPKERNVNWILSQLKVFRGMLIIQN